MFAVELEEVKKAQSKIAPYIRKTPLLPFEVFKSLNGKEVLLKCEIFQRTGSFKIRGAANCILGQLDKAKKHGVVAASAGNHAQGVAAIAHSLGVKATIVMPTNTPLIKVENTKGWGAEVLLRGDVFDESRDFATQLSKEKNLVFIHAFRDEHIIAGQGTVGLELMESPEFMACEALVISVGGGGLLTGIASVVKRLHPKIKIYGVTAKNAPTFFNSYKSKKPQESEVSYTLAEGVATKKCDAQMLSWVSDNVDNVFSIGEDSIASSIAMLAERAKMVVEGAGALPLAALLEGLIPEKKVTLLLSGGNLDISALSKVLSRGLSQQGRLSRLLITISDRPGMLKSITEVVAQHGANILQVFHQRDTLHTGFGETEVEIDLETRGHEHAEEISRALLAKGLRVQRST